MIFDFCSSSQSVRYHGLNKLPVIQYLEELFPSDHLAEVYVIACQHILPSTHMMFRSLFDLGLSKERVAVIGKCYSTNNKTMKNMINEGITVCSSSNKFVSNQSFDEQFRVSIKEFLAKQIMRMKPNRNAKIIILDDGGELITEAYKLLEEYPNICGVEQTSSGYRKIDSMELKMPVVNVAFSTLKLNFESPLIASSIIEILERRIGIKKAQAKDILIIGGGAIGYSLRDAFAESCSQHRVFIHDLIKDKSEIEYPDYNAYDLIIGATGSKSFSRYYYDQLKEGTILASVSSSDREFDSAYFRALSGKKWKAHDDVKHNGICLLNSGFPLNFSGEDVVSIPLKQIQLVCGLLFLGVCELVDVNLESGRFLTVSIKNAGKLVEKYNAMCEGKSSFSEAVSAAY